MDKIIIIIIIFTKLTFQIIFYTSCWFGFLDTVKNVVLCQVRALVHQVQRVAIRRDHQFGGDRSHGQSL